MKHEQNYHIFRLENTKGRIFPVKITVQKIYAKNDDDAYNQLKKYIKTADKQYKYYVDKWNPVILIRNGKKIVADDYYEAVKICDKLDSWYKKIYNTIRVELNYWFIKNLRTFIIGLEMLYNLLKHKHQYCASWSVDDALLNTLLFNIPLLKKYKYSLSWTMLEKAYSEKHPKCSKEKVYEYFKTHYNGYGDDIEKRAIELEHKMFDQLIMDIKTYKYYLDDFWYIDKNDKDLVELDKKLRPTLPLIKGTYDRYDQDKLNALIEKYWNRIWETVRKYGREFND